MSYPLDFLIQIIESKCNVNIEFENFGNILKIKNTKINKIVVSDNSFDLYLENFISQSHTDISQIKRIDKCMNELDLYDDIQKVRELIANLSHKDKGYFDTEFNLLTQPIDVCGF